MNSVSLSIHPTTDGLIVQSPAVAEGYDTPDASLENGVFQTTDIVELTTDGILRLIGRTGDMINVAGRKIAPSMIEEHILQVLGVRHCVTFGVPSPDVARVEEIITCVALDPGHTLSAVSLAAAQILPEGCRPRHWHHTPDLASDSRGKISRVTWRQRWLDGLIDDSRI